MCIYKKENNPISSSNIKNKICRNKLNQGGERCTPKTTKSLMKEIKEDTKYGNISHVHGLENVI